MKSLINHILLRAIRPSAFSLQPPSIGKCRPNQLSNESQESGATLIFFAVLVAVIVMITSLVVDHAKEEISVNNLQRSADAAALGAARRLNGRIDGWWDSKRAAVLAMKLNPVHGADQTELAKLKLTSGPSAFWDNAKNIPKSVLKGVSQNDDAPSENSGNFGTAGGVEVTVERGLYWATSGGYQFTSLEADDDGLKGATNYYLIANAVRVTARLKKLHTIFGGIFQNSSFDNLTRVSIAVMDSNLEREVAPVGVSLCQLLFDTNPNVTSGDHLTDKFYPRTQCERETFVAESDAKGDLRLDLASTPLEKISTYVSRKLRNDGLTRSESFVRQPYFTNYQASKPNVCFSGNFTGSAINCKAIPLYATLGLPATGPHQTATADEVVSAFKENVYTARVGSYFKALDSLKGMNDDASRQAIADAINDAKNPTIQATFMAGNKPKPNFPFLRTTHINPQSADPQGRPTVGGVDAEDYDRNLTAPAPEGLFGNGNNIRYLMQDMSKLPGNNDQLTFSNPMCHDEAIPHNDPERARAKKVYAMVIAPGLEKYQGDLVKYCDFENVFSGQDQKAVAPIPDSEPTVVGFVPMNLFDFNFQFLNTRTAGVVDPRNPSIKQDELTPVYLNGKGALWDGDPDGINLSGGPGYVDYLNNAKSYQQEYEQSLDDCKSNPLGALVNCNTPAFPSEKFTIPQELDDCFDFSEYKFLYKALQHINHGNGEQTIQAFVDILQKPIPVLNPNPHCLPRLKDGKFNKNVAENYTKLHSLEAGVGCGAVRAKMDCGPDTMSIPTGQDSMDNSPTLVADPEA